MKKLLIPFIIYSSTLFSCEFCDDVPIGNVKQLYTDIMSLNEKIRDKIYEEDQDDDEDSDGALMFLFGKSQAYHDCIYLMERHIFLNR